MSYAPYPAGSRIIGMHMTTIASRVIEFLTNLHAMDRLQTGLEAPRHAAIDLHSATIYDADPDFPDAEMLRAELASGKQVQIHTYKLIGYVLLRHAHAEAAEDGRDVRSAHENILDHFKQKTGYGQ